MPVRSPLALRGKWGDRQAGFQAGRRKGAKEAPAPEVTGVWRWERVREFPVVEVQVAPRQTPRQNSA